MAEIDIFDHQLPDDNYNLYDVTFYGDQIRTLVTTDPSMVSSWISETERIHYHRLQHLIVGLDVEWRPNCGRNYDNPVATLQLCVGRRCLVFQILHSPSVPATLSAFLSNQNYTFVGVGIEEDVEKLCGDYGLSVANTVDVRGLAAEELRMNELRNAGLKGLSRHVLGKEVAKPKNVTMSRWDYEWLTPPQVQYACIDAFVSFEIGRTLNASDAAAANRRRVGGGYHVVPSVFF